MIISISEQQNFGADDENKGSLYKLRYCLKMYLGCSFFLDILVLNTEI